MFNPGQPTLVVGATGEPVRRLQRALRRTPNLSVLIDGVFGPAAEAALRQFQAGEGLTMDGVVGPLTWQALPDGGPMTTLQVGAQGELVRRLQQVLDNGASEWGVSAGAVDGDFGGRPGRRSRPCRAGPA